MISALATAIGWTVIGLVVVVMALVGLSRLLDALSPHHDITENHDP